MFQSVTVTNYRGDSLELPLRWPNDSGLLLYKIDGITPGEVTVNSSDYAVLDGGVFNSARIGTRTIVLNFYYGFTPQIESARHRAYRYFPVKTEVRLDFLTDERALSIWGWVKENETQIFSEQEEGQITVVCPDPYFYEQTQISYTLGSSKGEFEFPFSNESLTDPLICFGDYGPKSVYDVNYQGDIEVGAFIRIHFLKKPTINSLSIYDVTNNKTLKLNFEEISSYLFGTGIEPYSDIIINSVRGQKDIYYERFGKRKSIIGAFDVMNFPWMYLTPGENRFGFYTEQEYLDEFEITVEHRGAYGGV